MRFEIFRRRQPVEVDECQAADITPREDETPSPDGDRPSNANIDEPITSIDDDRLDRGPFAQKIAYRINDVGTAHSVVFGLAGAWGSGKTSAVGMVRAALEKEIGGWRVVEFTPWAAADTQAVTEEFYEAIASAMPATRSGEAARNLLMTAVPVSAAVAKAAWEGLFDKRFGEGTWQKVLGAAANTAADELGNYEAKPDPFQARFTKISKAIAKTGTKILVVVDDLDRLHIDELLTVMKAVRLLGRFPGVHYLLSYDERTILDLLQRSDLAHEDEDRARAYLEKIVQYPFVLPPLQSVHFERELREQL
ncbi:MAG: hypothetical protein EOP24_48095, partial [Hyphomicrobiales bacterium]